MIDAQAASTTALHASPASSTVGQAVTFTATFTTACAGTTVTHGFSIDGKAYSGTYTQSGVSGTEVLSISTLLAGRHVVTYSWRNPPVCRGSVSITYTVIAAPPTPTPSPSPTPTPSPSPSPSPANVNPASAPSPLIAYLGIAFIVVTALAGAALAFLSRR